MSEENKKINFFKSAFKSIKDLDKYEDFALELPKKAFKYFLELVAFFCIIISIFYTYKIVDNMSNMYAKLKDILPDFSYSQGNLKMNAENPIVIEDYKDTFGKIIIDTNINEDEIDEYKKEIQNDGAGIIILKNECVILSNGTVGQVEYKYNDMSQNYNINEFTKQDVMNYVDKMNIVSVSATIYFIIFIYLFVVYFVSIFIDVLILSLLAFIVSRFSRIKLKYAPSFNIAIHSITLPVLLNLIYIIVNLLTGFRIKYFQLMYNTISYIYIIVAILMIKTDFINRQMELIKIAKEQEKIKEEIKNKEQDEKDKKPVEKDNKKDSDKKNKKDKKEKDNPSDEPVGDASITPEEK